jgi:hypothetical protein
MGYTVHRLDLSHPWVSSNYARIHRSVDLSLTICYITTICDLIWVYCNLRLTYHARITPEIKQCSKENSGPADLKHDLMSAVLLLAWINSLVTRFAL